MRKTGTYVIISIGILILITIWSFGATASDYTTNKCPNSITPFRDPHLEVFLTQYEVVLVRNGYLAVIPNVTSRDELLAFVQQNRERLRSLGNGEVVSATITFKRPLRNSELLRLLGNNVKIVAVRYKSYPEGIGQMPYPMEVYESERLKRLEEHLKKELKEKNNIGDFRLIEGFISAKVIAPKEELVRISKSKDVFDVNIGPRNLAEKYRIKQMIIEDVWWEYEKYILKQQH